MFHRHRMGTVETSDDLRENAETCTEEFFDFRVFSSACCCPVSSLKEFSPLEKRVQNVYGPQSEVRCVIALRHAVGFHVVFVSCSAAGLYAAVPQCYLGSMVST